MFGWRLEVDICKCLFHYMAPADQSANQWMNPHSYALAADIQTIPGLPTAPGYLNVDIDTETGEIDGLF
jgi:hypothetical protein